MEVKSGLAYIHIYNPCLTGWGIRSDESIEVSRLSFKAVSFPSGSPATGSWRSQ